MKVTVTIDKKTGIATVAVEGVKGPSCLKLTRQLHNDSLGKIRNTSEFFQREEETVALDNRISL